MIDSGVVYTRLSHASRAMAELLEQTRRGVTIGDPVERRIRLYLFHVVDRICSILDDLLLVVRNDRPIATAMCARGIIETSGVLLEFQRKFCSAMDRSDFVLALSVFKNFVFASREFGVDYSLSTPHVLNGIRTLDGVHPGIERAYDILCEVVHPNWASRGDSAISVERTVVAALVVVDVFRLSIDCFLLMDDFLQKNRLNLRKIAKN